MAFDVGSLVAGAASLGSAAIGAVSSSKNTKRSIEYQKAENERNREYNLNLAKQQNAWNIQQWERENKYSSPAEQMARLKAAGLNPDLAYSSGSPGGASASSPQMTAGAPSSPVDYSPIASQKNIGDYLMESTSIASMLANVKKTQAETKAIETTTTGQESQNKILASDASFREALNTGTVKLNAVTLENTAATTHLSNVQVEKLRSEIANIDTSCESLKQSIEESRARVLNMTEQQLFKKIELGLANAKTQAEIKSLAAANNLTYAQVRQLTALLPGLLTGQKMSNIESYNRGRMLDIQRANEELRSRGIKLSNESTELSNAAMSIDLKQATYYDKELDGVGVAGGMIRCLQGLVDSFFGGAVGALLK